MRLSDSIWASFTVGVQCDYGYSLRGLNSDGTAFMRVSVLLKAGMSHTGLRHASLRYPRSNVVLGFPDSIATRSLF